MIRQMSKKEILSLLKNKNNGIITDSYAVLSRKSGYSVRQLKRYSKLIEEKDIEELMIHANTGRSPAITASDQEISYIVNYKAQYPDITIAQFKDFYDEDIINNPKKSKDVKKYGLKTRSLSFFRNLFVKYGWKSVVRHRKNIGNDKQVHHLRNAMPRKGMLIQIDGTPFDWLGNGEMWSLHLAIDDATKEIIAGWFTKNECLYGYLKVVEIMIREHGIPIAMYSDKHAIFKSKDEINGETKFQAIMKRLGIETILANSSQAKGRVERYNGTCQRRLPNDIKRHNIKTYDQLNEWFNSSYKHYLNKKFAKLPLDPYEEFVPVDSNFNYLENLSIIEERVIQNGDLFSYENCLFSPLNEETGEILHITKGVKVKILHDILNKKLYIKRYNKLIPCTFIQETRAKDVVDNKKDARSRISDFIDKRR